MKKAVIITECRRYFFNYGETLQAVALNHLITGLGFQTITASYENQERGRKHLIEKSSWKYNLIILKFEIFRKKYIKLPIFRSCNKECYEKLLQEADVVLCGSDCIWCERDINDIYCLEFPTIDIPKIAYAPSIRDCKIHSIYKYSKFVEKIGKINYVSTRETEGSRIISELTGRHIETVLDPTLVCGRNYWNKLCAKQQEKAPYILCYMLGKTRTFSKIYTQIQKRYLNRKILWINIEKNDGYPIGKVLYGCGPAEFLTLIRYADAVITDSFHGTAFSLLFEKQFFVLKRAVSIHDRYDNDCRITNILEQLDLKNYYTRNECINFEDAYIDYEIVTPTLNKLRKKSMEYLKNALRKENLL